MAESLATDEQPLEQCYVSCGVVGGGFDGRLRVRVCFVSRASCPVLSCLVPPCPCGQLRTCVLRVPCLVPCPLVPRAPVPPLTRLDHRSSLGWVVAPRSCSARPLGSPTNPPTSTPWLRAPCAGSLRTALAKNPMRWCALAVSLMRLGREPHVLVRYSLLGAPWLRATCADATRKKTAPCASTDAPPPPLRTYGLYRDGQP